VTNKEYNDPQEGLLLATVLLSRTPVYIRFEPSGNSPNWNLNLVSVLVYAPQFVVGYMPSPDFDNLWFGDDMGKILFLTTEWWRGEKALREIGEQMAEKIKNASGK